MDFLRKLKECPMKAKAQKAAGGARTKKLRLFDAEYTVFKQECIVPCLKPLKDSSAPTCEVGTYMNARKQTLMGAAQARERVLDSLEDFAANQEATSLKFDCELYAKFIHESPHDYIFIRDCNQIMNKVLGQQIYLKPESEVKIADAKFPKHHVAWNPSLAKSERPVCVVASTNVNFGCIAFDSELAYINAYLSVPANCKLKPVAEKFKFFTKGALPVLQNVAIKLDGQAYYFRKKMELNRGDFPRTLCGFLEILA